MSFLQSFILGIIQGLTEFLPVSSSAHLVLVPYIFNWNFPESQVFPFDVLVQIGTLVAVIVYFWKDLWSIIRSFILGLIRRKPFETPEALMGWYLIIATIPAGLAGVFLKDKVEAAFNNPRITAIFLFVTALFLLASEFFSRRSRKLEQMTWLDALIVGIFQAFSIFPGISRSGSTITGGMLRHLERPAAARFAFLMSIPIMLAAGIFSIPDLLEVPDLGSFLPVLALGFVAAAVVGYLSIHWLLTFLNKRSLIYFAAYCVLLASTVLIISNLRPISTVIAVEPTDEPTNLQQINAEIRHIVQITSDPTTEWLLPAASECATDIPELTLVTSGSFPENQEELLTIIDFNWGEPDASPAYASILAEPTLVFIVNPKNPLVQLPLPLLADILNGAVVTWGDLLANCPDCYDEPATADILESHIQLIAYPADSNSQQAFEQVYKVSPQVANAAIIVPTTAAMNETVLNDSSALGFLPAPAANDEVLKVSVTDSEGSVDPSLPLLAITQSDPQGTIRQWLGCIQQKLTP